MIKKDKKDTDNKDEISRRRIAHFPTGTCFRLAFRRSHILDQANQAL
jgi:hypothetical protein